MRGVVGMKRSLMFLIVAASCSVGAANAEDHATPTQTVANAVTDEHALGPTVCADHPSLVGSDQPKGPTRVHFHIGIDGSTHDMTVQTSSGRTDFDAAALQCVAAWKFSPATSNGHPIDKEIDAEMDWGAPPVHDYSVKTALVPDLADLTPMVHRLGLDTRLEPSLSRVMKYEGGAKGWRCRQVFLEIKDEHRTKHWFARDFDDGPDLMYARIKDHHYVAAHLRIDGTFVAAVAIDDVTGTGNAMSYDEVKTFLDEEVAYWNCSGQTGR